MQINKESECKIIKKPMIMTQEKWVNHFNNEGEGMVSAPNIYQTAKTGNKALIESLKQDLKKEGIMTSSQIRYNKKTLFAEIIHNVGSKFAKIKKYKVEIPVFDGDFEENTKTEKYLQALFDTKGSIDKILKTLKKFGKDKKLRLWTPDQSYRKKRPIRSVVLCFDGFDRFYVGGDGWFDDSEGLSRGVIIDSAKQTKKRRKSK
ncbi:hypothetical protein LCGC14_0515140 [marine sediment metagenome]|uniref:Uncharacterized protein n=1 Tax=marine sediment metagenome TaxID=412755 RepID=A0A0F9V8E1_9ZZZZ